MLSLYACLLTFIAGSLGTFTTEVTDWTCKNAEQVDVGVATMFSSAVFKVQLTTRSITGNSSLLLKFRIMEAYVGQMPKGSRKQKMVVTIRSQELSADCLVSGQPYFLFVNISSNSGLMTGSSPSLIVLWSQPAETQVRRNTCNRACSKPTVSSRRTKSLLNITQGNKFGITCRITGKPIPMVLWTKNHIRMQHSSHVKIMSKSGRSQLTVTDATEDDAGTYRCQAFNIVGASKPIRMRVIVGMPDTVNDAAHCPRDSVMCGVHGHCLNGGICCIFENVLQSKRFCQCPPEFTGLRCERKVSDPDLLPPSPFSVRSSINAISSETDTGILVIVVVIVLLLSAVLFIIIGVLARRLCQMKNRVATNTEQSRGLVSGDGHPDKNTVHVACSDWQYSSAPPDHAAADDDDAVNDAEHEISLADTTEQPDINSDQNELSTMQLASMYRPQRSSEAANHPTAHSSAMEVQCVVLDSYSTMSRNSKCGSVSDVEANRASDAEILDVDDDHYVSTPGSLRGTSTANSLCGGDTTSWTQDDADSIASNGNDLLRQLEAYSYGNDPTLDDFAADGVIPSLDKFIGVRSNIGMSEWQDNTDL